MDRNKMMYMSGRAELRSRGRDPQKPSWAKHLSKWRRFARGGNSQPPAQSIHSKPKTLPWKQHALACSQLSQTSCANLKHDHPSELRYQSHVEISNSRISCETIISQVDPGRQQAHQYDDRQANMIKYDYIGSVFGCWPPHLNLGRALTPNTARESPTSKRLYQRM